MSIGSICGGFGAGMLAIAFNGYISMLCVKNKCEDESGKYFGIFSTITSSCFIFGSLISTFIFAFF
jgi:MFS family permease